MKVNKTLGLSIISVVLSIVLLAGTTFAWFTDTVENEDNVIQIGNLKVDLEKYEADAASDDGEDAEHNDHYVSIAGKTGSLFDDTLWAPGTMQIVYLKAQNEGNLALDYSFILNVNVPEGQATNPADAFKYAIIDDAEYGDLDGKNWTDIETAVGADKVVALEEGIEPLKTDVQLPAGESDYFALVLHMKESAGNGYQGGTLKIDVQLVAKQSALENDAFGNGFDSNAGYGEDMWIPEVEPEQPGPTGPVYAFNRDFEGGYAAGNWYNGGSADYTTAANFATGSNGTSDENNTYFIFGEDFTGYTWAGVKISGAESGLEAGKTYTLSCKIKTERGTTNGYNLYAKPQINVKFYQNRNEPHGSAFTYAGEAHIEEADGVWYQFTGQFTVPADWDGSIVDIGVWNRRYKNTDGVPDTSTQCGNILIDDFQISLVTE